MGCELYIIKRRHTMQDVSNTNIILENRKKREVNVREILKAT